MEQPPQYAAYPRGTEHGSADKLRALRTAYYGAYWMIAVTLVAALLGFAGGFVIGLMTRDPDSPLAIFAVIGTYAVLFIGNFLVSFKYAKLIAFAKSKEASYAILLSIGATLLSPCCVGAVGAAVLQQTAANEIKNYGLKVGFFGLSKDEVDAKLAELEASQGAPRSPF